MATPPSLPIAFKVLTVNVHKGFTTFNRRFMLHELREAVRGVAADLVFLQEVQGSHQRHAQRVANFPQVPHYEFLADTIWSQYAYGRNAVYDNGDHGNALLSKFPITHYENHDISIRGPERRGMLHCVLQPPGHHLPVHAVCVHLGLQESHRQQQLQRVCDLINGFPADEPVVLAGGQTPRESMPDVVQNIMLAAPTTHFIKLAQAILFRGAGFEVVWPSFLSLFVIGSVFFYLALKRFKNTIHTMA